jgi:hypothetical protein
MKQQQPSKLLEVKFMKTFKLFAVFLLLAVFAAPAQPQKMKPEDVLAKHLESIGTAEARAAVKNQMAVGDALVTFVSQKNQPAQGRIVLVSEGTKNFLGMNLNAADYPLEKFSYDGKNAKVAFVRNNVRSILGNFILSNDLLLEESLLGGALATSWGLSNTATNKAKISFDGAKKIDGKEVYVLGYSPKGGGDVDVKIYFEKDTFRHIRTEYKRTSSASIGRTIDESARQSETRLKVTENFSDFKAENGLTLPHSYILNYSVIGQNGTTEIEWKFAFTQFAFNQNLDAKTFDAEAK